MKNRKLLRAMSMIFALLLMATSALVVVPFSTTATDANTVEINSVSDLYSFASSAEANGYYAGKTVKLNVDLDLTGEKWTPVPEFKGTFDGNGKTIQGLVIEGATERLAMFDKLNGATLKNFCLNATITQTAGDGMIAVLAVETVGEPTTIDGVYVKGGINAVADNTNSYRHAGFIAYAAADTTIKNSACGATIFSAYKTNAGFVGASKYGTTLTMTDCAYYGAIAKQVGSETASFVARLGGNATFTRCITFGFNQTKVEQWRGAFIYLDTKSFETNDDNALASDYTPPVVVLEDCYANISTATYPLVGTHGSRNKYNLTVKYAGANTYTTPADGAVVYTDASAACKTIAVGAEITLTKDNFETVCPGFTTWVATSMTAQSVQDAPVPVFLPECVTKIKPGTFVKGESLIEVATADELLAAAAKIEEKGGFDGKTVELTADIDMTGKTWTMVSRFAGIFDGNGFAIKNLKIENTADTAKDGLAMFKTIDGATIKNLIITGVDIDQTVAGGYNTAVLAAWADGDKSTIENVYIDGTVTADKTNSSTTRISGFVGHSMADIEFKNCVSAVALSGYSTLGGFLGTNAFGTTTTMTDCVFTGSTDSVKSEVSGIIGRLVGNTTMTRVISLGNVVKADQWCGLFGYLDSKDYRFKNDDGTYSNQKVTGITGTASDSKIEPVQNVTLIDCYAAYPTATSYALGNHGTRKVFNVTISYSNMDAPVYTSTETSDYVKTTEAVKALATADAVAMTKDNFASDFALLAVADWVMTDKEILYNATGKIGEIMPDAVAAMLKRNVVAQYSVTVTPDWKADANGVFNIATPGDLLAFAANAEANGWYNGKVVQLTADINMKKVDFVPLTRFMGYFEGNGYTIKNLTVEQAAQPLGGLFNLADGMTMKNVRFEGGSVTMVIPEGDKNIDGSMLGGIVGDIEGNFPCTFENIYIDSDLSVPVVNTAYRIGGLIGNISISTNENITDVPVITIKNCVSAVTVLSSYKAAAGFVGSNAFGTKLDISDCAFLGSFVKTNAENSAFVGRVVGSLNLTRCINLTVINQFGNRYSGTMCYLDNKDFILGPTNGIAAISPPEVNIVDCFTILTGDTQNAVGAHDSRNIYKLTISYTGEETPAYTNANDKTFVSDYVAATAAVKQLAFGSTVNLNKDNFATMCPTLTSWKLTGDTVEYSAGSSIVEVLPTTVVSMLDGTFTKGTLPTEVPEWKFPEPPQEEEGDEGDDQETEPETDPVTEPVTDPATEPATEEVTTGAPTEKKKGCGSVVGGALVAIISIAGGAMLLTRKKED